ncbi:MAG TPA: cytochrome c-type biogenesis CcmF C-terminal domain-containing protein [Polyangiaceae bacterium]|nr:cytochrome c-type biogenesis CcmF C-terminal domain-containing protein [Polyangiaceae bacterium]
MWNSLPGFGTGILYAMLVAAAYTFAVAVAAGRGQPRLLESARRGAFATSGLVALGVLVLAYAFVTHDFRIRYVTRYSDRSMPTGYLIASLWGGQDGSLLWWSFLLSLYTSACVFWLRGKYRQLQPYVIATLMVIMGFFAILMLFAANPFESNLAGAKLDGEGLNPLLQNYWMAIHPPSLYTGFVGCSVPFSFAIAALVTGRLDNEWIVAVRKWMLFAWLFLSIGNALGMAWAYEELGWGGYWAWDPVENAACLPWFAASAYVHSTMIQERRNMLKIWNVVLIVITFLLTIFGTFLTRAGLISSVHAFAQSDIGIFFLWFMGFVFAVTAGLVVWRLPQLRSRGQIEAVLSREAAFVVNNWLLVGIATFILIATIFPRISEWLWKETVTVGPPFFNRWMAPLGLGLLLLMGVGPLFGWRKTSGVSLKRAFAFPSAVALAVLVLHVALGKRLGFPAFVQTDAFYPGLAGVFLQKLGACAPAVTICLAAFNFAVVAQEFYRGVAARRSKHSDEGVLEALRNVVDKSRRRYGGYIVHIGVGLMFVGFCGRAWEIEHEASMSPGDQHEIGEYTVTYRGPRMEVDPTKRMIFADVDVERNGKSVGRLSPARFIYTKAGQPTTEVSMMRGLRDDLYLVVGMINPQTKRATLRFHVNPLVSWVWIGVLVLMGGASISLWPEVRLREVGVWGYLRATAGAATSIMLAIVFATAPARAESAVAGTRSRVAAVVATPPASAPLSPFAHGAALATATGIVIAVVRGRISLRKRS